MEKNKRKWRCEFPPSVGWISAVQPLEADVAVDFHEGRVLVNCGDGPQELPLKDCASGGRFSGGLRLYQLSFGRRVNAGGENLENIAERTTSLLLHLLFITQPLRHFVGDLQISKAVGPYWLDNALFIIER